MFFPDKKTDIVFALFPKKVRGGWVWLEWVHADYEHHGLGGVRYHRWVPQVVYDRGVRWPEWENSDDKCAGKNLSANPTPTYYNTPPEGLCKNRRTDGPTPCWFPHCMGDK